MANVSIGGQAVMEGVMLRFRDWLSIAVRTPKGEIIVETRKWWSLSKKKWQKKPLIRGFFILLETLVNGIKALNFSTKTIVEEEGEELPSWTLILSLVLALGFGLLLFVFLPHGISLLLNKLGISGDLNSFSFHFWDGVSKFIIFILYILGISLLPEIKRVFEYHGAEHKTIHAFENQEKLTPQNIKKFSRLHPRCGTSFLLFVLALSIILFTIVVPLFFKIFPVENFWLRHLIAVGLKIILMVPISGLAYETIKLASQKENTWWCKLLCLPGLFFQLLTTKEPDEKQIEVAVAALENLLERGNYAG